MRVVVAIPAGALIAGCAIGLHGPEAPVAAAMLAVAGVALVAFRAMRVGRQWLLVAAVAAGFAGGGVLLAQAAWRAAWRPSLRVAFESIARDERRETNPRAGPEPVEEVAAVVLVGVLRRDASPTSGGGVSLDVDVVRVGRARASPRGRDPAINPVEGRVLLTVAGTMAGVRLSEWPAGRTIRTFATLRRPARYLNPGVPDQERVLALHGVTLVGSVKSGALVDVVSAGGLVSEGAASIRAFTRRAIASAVAPWSPRSAGIVTAIVIGDRTGLRDEDERRLQEAGTYHVIAISGGNIAILAGVTLLAFRIAGLLGPLAMMAATGGLLSYGYIVGGGASVDRATLMASVYFIGRALDLHGPPLNALALVAGLLVVSDPLAIADPAFLLTFGATAAILAAAPIVPPRRLPRIVAALAGMFVASAAAEAALLPVAATIFSRVTFAGLVLNFAAIPLMAVAQLAGMLLVLVFGVSAPLASVLGWVAHIGAEGLVRSADLVRVAPAVTWRVAAPSPFIVATYYAGGVTAFALWRRLTNVDESRHACRFRRAAATAVAVAGLWIVAEPWPLARSGGDGRLHVTFIDVGQGDAALVRFPHGQSMLVDAGGLTGGASFDVGDRVVAPVLRQAGIRRLSVLALSHGDADHAGGAQAVALEFRPAAIWEGVPVPRSAMRERMRTVALAVRSPWSNVQSGDSVEIDGVTVATRHPALPDWERQDVRNDDSVVLELLWRDVSIVLTGDIGAAVEREIGQRFPKVPLRVVKVPHHGSLSSSSDAFVRALAPRVAVVSVGRGNRFGHPAPAVVQRYARAGADVFRTDRDGAVTIDTDGHSLELSTFTGHRARISPNDPGPDDRSVPLRQLPLGFELIERHGLQRAARGRDGRLHVRESSRELLVGPPQRRFGLDLELARQVGDRKEEVSHLLFGPPGVDRSGRLHHFPNLFDFLANLRDDVVGAGPVEADRRRPRADLVGAQQGGKCRGNATQERRRFVLRGPLGALDLFPAHLHLAGRVERGLAVLALKHVRMAAHELVGDRADGIGDRETPGFLFELGEEDRLEEEVAQLLSKRVVVVPIDRVEHLVGLLEHVLPQRVDRLLAIPRTPVGRPERRHDLHEPREFVSGARHAVNLPDERAFVHPVRHLAGELGRHSLRRSGGSGVWANVRDQPTGRGADDRDPLPARREDTRQPHRRGAAGARAGAARAPTAVH